MDHGVIRIAAALIVKSLTCPDDDGDDAARDQRKGVAREFRHMLVELLLETSRDKSAGCSGVAYGLGEFCRSGPLGLLAELPNQLDRRQKNAHGSAARIGAARLCGGHM